MVLPTTLSGSVPLDEVIAASEAAKHTLAEIHTRLARSRQMAATPGALPHWSEVVEDWLAILAVKERRHHASAGGLADPAPPFDHDTPTDAPHDLITDEPAEETA